MLFKQLESPIQKLCLSKCGIGGAHGAAFLLIDITQTDRVN